MNSSLSKADQWAARFSHWQASGLTQSAFCKKHHLKMHTFQYWRKILKDMMPGADGRFLPVEFSPEVTASEFGESIILHFNGITVDVNHDTDFPLLTKCLSSLGYQHD